MVAIVTTGAKFSPPFLHLAPPGVEFGHMCTGRSTCFRICPVKCLPMHMILSGHVTEMKHDYYETRNCVSFQSRARLLFELDYTYSSLCVIFFPREENCTSGYAFPAATCHYCLGIAKRNHALPGTSTAYIEKRGKCSVKGLLSKLFLCRLADKASRVLSLFDGM